MGRYWNIRNKNNLLSYIFNNKILDLAILRLGAFAALRDYSFYPTQRRQDAKILNLIICLT